MNAYLVHFSLLITDSTEKKAMWPIRDADRKGKKRIMSRTCPSNAAVKVHWCLSSNSSFSR